MKKIIFILLVLLLFVGCSNNKDDNPSSVLTTLDCSISYDVEYGLFEENIISYFDKNKEVKLSINSSIKLNDNYINTDKDGVITEASLNELKTLYEVYEGNEGVFVSSIADKGNHTAYYNVDILFNELTDEGRELLEVDSNFDDVDYEATKESYESYGYTCK